MHPTTELRGHPVDPAAPPPRRLSRPNCRAGKSMLPAPAMLTAGLLLAAGCAMRSDERPGGDATITAQDSEAAPHPQSPAPSVDSPPEPAVADGTTAAGGAPDTASPAPAVPRTLEEARTLHDADPADESAIIWLGRHLAYAGDYEQAILVFTEGLRIHPQSARLLRHRGHRFISVRRFGEAVRDLDHARRRLSGQPDEVEPDGRPNALGIPRSTLHTNVLYHLGLAHYLLGGYAEAGARFAECLEISPNDDMRVAAGWWTTLCLIQLGSHEQARALAARLFETSTDVIENEDYRLLLGLIAGVLQPHDVAPVATGAPLELADMTRGYGLAMWHILHGRRVDARRTLDRICAAPATAAFGRIAAEIELHRLAPPME
ncbi:MAG: tetratricopeptide repeat protein [Phycisphaeraceae bacterium]|nr:tetratricopeptide repeat protein [Phycisphaeraceae bacterium]